MKRDPISEAIADARAAAARPDSGVRADHYDDAAQELKRLHARIASLGIELQQSQGREAVFRQRLDKIREIVG